MRLLLGSGNMDIIKTPIQNNNENSIEFSILRSNLDKFRSNFKFIVIFFTKIFFIAFSVINKKARPAKQQNQSGKNKEANFIFQNGGRSNKRRTLLKTDASYRNTEEPLPQKVYQDALDKTLFSRHSST